MKVSVIIPCYNVENYIDRCLDSVYGQTVGNDVLEVILINDGSTDDTCRHLRNYEHTYSSNTVLVELDMNSGLSAARNVGLEYASGEYITFIDADDVVADTMIERMLSVISEDHCEMVECSYKRFKDISECRIDGSGEITRYNLTENEIRKEYIVNVAIKSAVWGRLYDSKFIKENNFCFIEKKNYEDVHYTILGMFLFKSVSRIDETLYFYYQNETGIIGTSDNEKLKQEIDIIRETLEELDRRKILDEVLNDFYPELEYYCFRKGFVDPVSILMINKSNNIDENILYFKNSITEFFPDVANNPYANHMAEISELWSALLQILGGGGLKKEPCITVKIIGGLGNQMRCFFAGYMISKELNLSLSLDITDYYYGYFRQYVLDYLNVPNDIKLWHSIDIPVYGENPNLPDSIKRMYDIFVNIDDYTDREALFLAIKNKSCIYLYGYDLNGLFEDEIRLHREMLSPRIHTPLLSHFIEMTKNQNSVSVHVRRTDFLTLKWSGDGTKSFYISAMNYIREKVDNPVFYIFSDDTKWAKDNFGKIGDCIVVDSLGGEVQSLYDMFCMSECKHHILTRKSTYSKWASFLSSSEGINICEASRGDDIEDYSILNAVLFTPEMTEQYAKEGMQDDITETSYSNITPTFLLIEEYIGQGNFAKAMDIINNICLSNEYNLSDEERLSLLEYRAIIYFQNEEYELALDSFRCLRGSRTDYDFLYNYGLCLEMTGHHAEAMCYAAVAKCINAESDIDNIVFPTTEDELFVWNTLMDSYYKLCMESNIKLVFLSNNSARGVRKEIVSIKSLLQCLGFATYFWMNGVYSADELIYNITPGSVFITNIAENCFKIDGIPLVLFDSVGASDVDRYFVKRYSGEQKEQMKAAADIIVNSHERASMSKDIMISEEPMLTWDAYVNDDEMIWQCASILNSIV